MFVMGVCRATGGVGVSYCWVATQMGDRKLGNPVLQQNTLLLSRNSDLVFTLSN